MFRLGRSAQGAGRGASVVVGNHAGHRVSAAVSSSMDKCSRAPATNAGEVAYCPLDGADYDSACSGGGVVRRYESLAGAARALDANRIGDLAEGGDATARTAWKAYGATRRRRGRNHSSGPRSVVGRHRRLRRAQSRAVSSRVESAARKILAPPAAERFRLRRSQLGGRRRRNRRGGTRPVGSIY